MQCELPAVAMSAAPMGLSLGAAGPWRSTADRLPPTWLGGGPMITLGWRSSPCSPIETQVEVHAVPAPRAGRAQCGSQRLEGAPRRGMGELVRGWVPRALLGERRKRSLALTLD